MRNLLSFLCFWRKKPDSVIVTKVAEDLRVAKENLTEIKEIYEKAAKEPSLRKSFNAEHKETLRDFVFYHSLVMDNEEKYNQGTPMNVTLNDGLHCIMHHVFWDDMEEMMDDDRLRVDFYYKGDLLLITVLNTTYEEVKAKVLNKEDFEKGDKQLIDETYVKCMSPLVKKFELRWKKYKQEEELAEQERKAQEKIRKQRNKGKLDEFLNK